MNKSAKLSSAAVHVPAAENKTAGFVHELVAVQSLCVRWILVDTGWTCGGHCWTWGGHAVDIGGHAENLHDTSSSFYCYAAAVALMRSFL